MGFSDGGRKPVGRSLTGPGVSLLSVVLMKLPANLSVPPPLLFNVVSYFGAAITILVLSNSRRHCGHKHLPYGTKNLKEQPVASLPVGFL